MKTKTIYTLGTILCSLMVVAGCGKGNRPDLAPVHGNVTLDSKPLAGAMVVFQPEHGKASHGFTNAQGRYELTYLRNIEGAVLGRHTVKITTDTELAAVHGSKQHVPARYNRQSELRACETIQHIDFDYCGQECYDFPEPDSSIA